MIFLAVRVALLYARDPFFDELYTLWTARLPFGRIVPTLLHDTGPPLYYFVARFDSIVALRLLSLLFAAMQFALIVRRSVMAAFLIALYPPAALLAVDARAYALCALFVTAGVIALDEDKPYLGAFAFALAAHTHYYGVLFFPLLLVRRQWRAFLIAILLFVPGFMLAFHQPIGAMKWNRETLVAPLANLSFAGMYPDALFARPPVVLVVLALAALIFALLRPAGGRPYAVLVPLALVLALHLAGKPAYFPMRFEAVLAGPLVIWLADSRKALAAVLCGIGAITIYLGIVDHLQRPLDPYREAALVLRRMAPSQTVVATGYLYLETAILRPVIAWPADQAQHPGWRSTVKPEPPPPGSFLWIGERYAPELPALRGLKALRPLFWNERALIARADDLTRPVH